MLDCISIIHANKLCKYQIVVLATLSVVLSSCQGVKNLSLLSYSQTYNMLSIEDIGNTKYQGHYKIGQDYTIKGKNYKPRSVRSYTGIGIASWYGTRGGFHGKITANGDIFNKEMLTAAHGTLPLPSLVKVTNYDNGKSVIVLVNDRGPFRYNRIIDLSEKAAVTIGMRDKGTAKVNVEFLYSETKKFLKILGLKKKHGSRAERPLMNTRCTVNCHIKLINMKYKLM